MSNFRESELRGTLIQHLRSIAARLGLHVSHESTDIIDGWR